MRAQRVLSAFVKSFGKVHKNVPFNASVGRPAQITNGFRNVLFASGAGFTLGAVWYRWNQGDYFTNKATPLEILRLDAAAKAKGTPQPNTFSQTKNHALYLWIHLSPNADFGKCTKAVANVQKLVDQVSPPDLRDETDEVWAGVGFGEEFYKKVSPKKLPPHKYFYPHRKGELGEMPNTDASIFGGDIFIHAKSDTVSKLFELAQLIQTTLPKNSIARFSDVYSFLYQNGRDLSGFIDGTENPADDDSRFEVAVNKETGGSFCITQRWIHNLQMLNETKDSVLEDFVGRSRPDSTELKKKPATSHVARMTSGTNFDAAKPMQIVRQSMPYGAIGGEAGLFFIGFAASPQNFEYMLDRMVGTTDDKLSDDVMRFGKCVSGNYWYFPSAEELKALA